MSKMVNCKNCMAEIPANTKECPRCGEKVKKPFYKKWWVWALVIVVIIGIGSASNNSKTPSNQTTQTTTNGTTDNETASSSENTNIIKAGMYKIGTDIQAGEYFITGQSSPYYQVTSDSSGTLESIICNDNFENSAYLTVSDGQYVTLQRCTMIPVTDAQPQQANDGKYSGGMYKIGFDIPAGEYKIVSQGMGYSEIRTNSTGTLDGIVANDNFEGEKYITVQEGQYLKLNRCELLISQ